MSDDILQKFTGHLKNVLAKSYSLAIEMKSKRVNAEHLLLALLMQKGSLGGELLRKANMSAEEVRRVIQLSTQMDGPGDPGIAPLLSNEAKRAVEKSVLTANVHEHKYVGTEHLLMGLLQIDSVMIEAMLTDQHIDIALLKESAEANLKGTSKFPEITETFEVGHAPKAKTGEELKTEAKKLAKVQKAKTPALDFFAVELTNAKLQENIDPVFGREKEIERLIQILCRRSKNNPALLGEPGVGKTAIVEGLAKRILKGDVPAVLQNKRIFSLDLGLMLAGTIYRGEFEGRIKQVVDEVKANPDIIIFIDEMHNIMGAGSTSGSLDAANILKPALARGDLHCIGATTLAEFKKHIEGDGALERRFQAIVVEPPSIETAILILKGLRSQYEQYHGVTITDEAIRAAVEMSERYIQDRFLPDKAIDLIDEAAACVRVATSNEKTGSQAAELTEELEMIRKNKQDAVMNENFIVALEMKAKEKELEKSLQQAEKQHVEKKKAVQASIGEKEIAEVVGRATGIPATQLLTTEKGRLLGLEKILEKRIVGQTEAVKNVAEMVRRAKAGISNPNRPLASFLFLGPSGVGKTELAKTVAETLYNDKNALIRIDMSEFSEGFTASKLVGAPAGYVGYKDGAKLTDAIKRKPYALVLFDEIEKAHSDIHNLLLQILEDGHITDATGRKINFKHTIIVMTSNVGAARMLRPSIGFGEEAKGNNTAELEQESKGQVMQEVEKNFRPEFINRIDKVIVFNPLSQDALASIVELQIADLDARLQKDYGIRLTAKPELIASIAARSWNPAYGARTVRRHIQDLIETPLAQSLLGDSYSPGDKVVASLGEDGNVSLSKRKAHAATISRAKAS